MKAWGVSHSNTSRLYWFLCDFHDSWDYCLASNFRLGVKSLPAQKLKIEKIEPPNWWIGMKWSDVQLMVYGENLSDPTAEFDGIEILKIYKTENSSYAFIDIVISGDTEIGEHKLVLSNQFGSDEIMFPVMKRETEKRRHQGFSSKDVIYLLMHDRFVNGNLNNDNIDGRISFYCIWNYNK